MKSPRVEGSKRNDLHTHLVFFRFAAYKTPHREFASETMSIPPHLPRRVDAQKAQQDYPTVEIHSDAISCYEVVHKPTQERAEAEIDLPLPTRYRRDETDIKSNAVRCMLKQRSEGQIPTRYTFSRAASATAISTTAALSDKEWRAVFEKCCKLKKV